MATISACAVGSLARVTWLAPVAMTTPSFTTSAANGPPSRADVLHGQFDGLPEKSVASHDQTTRLRPRLRRLRFDQAGADGVAHHAGGLMDAQFFQDAAAVRIGGLVADAQDGGGLLGGLALGDQHQHLALALGQGEYHPHRFRVGREDRALDCVISNAEAISPGKWSPPSK